MAAILVALVLGSTSATHAQRRNERDVRDALRSINSKLDDFDSNIRYQMQSSGSGEVGELVDNLSMMRDAVRGFEDNLNGRRENAADIENIVVAAAAIDDLLLRSPQNKRVTDSWQGVRRQLDRLASNYGVNNDWDHISSTTTGSTQTVRIIPPSTSSSKTNGRYTVGLGISGTYGLDRQNSDNIEQAISNSSATGADQDDLRDKLTAPEQIAIDVRRNEVTIATSTASPISFIADGSERVETVNGRQVKMKATLNGEKLTLSSIGGDSDFTITFVSSQNGQLLTVTRRVTTEYLNQTVFSESTYNKTDRFAKLGIPTGNVSSGGNPNVDDDDLPTDIGVVNTPSSVPASTVPSDPNGGYSDNDQGNQTVANGGSSGGNRPQTNTGGTRRAGQPSAVYVKPGNYVVPDGSIITGNLENEINTKLSQNGDRFRLTVQSPDEYRGAVIEGYVTNIQRSGKVTGAASVTFNFEKITLRDGQTYDFAGTLKTAADSMGRSAKVDNEGTLRGDSQTAKTAKRSGIGAGLGALIGVIAGGGKGAAIGAILGGSGGAGSVFFEDRKDVQLNQGSTLTIQAAGPSR